MPESARPTYQAVVQAAVEATGATGGWLLGVSGDAFVVLAAHGRAGAGELVGTERAVRGAAGFVASSGQPAAMQVPPGDTDNQGAGGSGGTPTAVLAVPCGTEEVVGVIEIVDPPSGAFSFDDVETVTLLADVAGAALGEDGVATAPTPEVLAAGLARLAAADPARYSAVASAVEALL